MIDWLKRKGQQDMTAKIIGSVLRAALAAYGGAGAVSDNEVEQIAGAVALIVTVAWSVYQKHQSRADVAR